MKIIKMTEKPRFSNQYAYGQSTASRYKYNPHLIHLGTILEGIRNHYSRLHLRKSLVFVWKHPENNERSFAVNENFKVVYLFIQRGYFSRKVPFEFRLPTCNYQQDALNSKLLVLKTR